MDNLVTDENSEDEYPPIQRSAMNDDRMHILSVDSSYCDVDNSNDSLDTFKRATYCALHLNIHSLPSKHSQLKELLSRLKDMGVDIHFILLCETFLTTENADIYQIPGYKCIHQSRTTISRGGVAIYISR